MGRYIGYAARGYAARVTLFHKVLVANRGEIAVRVVRALRELGIASVAAYSDADRGSLAVRLADEAAYVGASPSSESYLRIDRVIDAAKRHGAEAIHPGYGFLSENAEFAEACAAAGIVFIGPPAEAIRKLGSKTAARRLAIAAGAPVVPGTEQALSGWEEARAAANALGYPVLLKASAGGGGKGMRRVDGESDLQSALRDAASEAGRAFGNSEVYIEKLVEEPRHIEIQILGDHHGHLIHLGERECSIQRRHQKVIEECPSPFMASHPDLREKMGQAALKVARAAGYTNAGTVEFLVDRDANFYFLEVNTRLQVEHPVTELATGLDLVEWQLKIAAGRAADTEQKRHHMARLGDRVPDLRRGSGSRFHARAGNDPALERAIGAGCPAGLGHLRGLDGAARIRSAAGEAGRVGADAGVGNPQAGSGALRVRAGGRSEQHRVFPRGAGRRGVSRGAAFDIVPGSILQEAEEDGGRSGSRSGGGVGA